MATISRKILIIILFLPLFLTGQNLKLEGHLTGNNVPLSFASISVKNTSIGTVSNAEGMFKLVVPQQYLKQPICISMLGYKTREVAVKDWKKEIIMERSAYILPEISILPDDSMLRVMRKAVDRIPENYLHTPTRQSGFYRTMLMADTSYQYFGEALLDVFKPSYKSKETGSVKILKSRINRENLKNGMPSLYFYGGIYMPFLADFVQQREAFLDPVHLKDYSYSIDEIFEQDGMTVLKISFAPKFNSNGLYKGYFHLDKNTLAFLDFNFSYSEIKREKRSKALYSNLQSISGSYILKYAQTEDHYFLKYIFYTEELKDQTTQKNYTKTNEYVTTEINRDKTTPIPLQEQDMLSTVFSVRATSVNESDWEDYTILTKEPLQLAYSEQQSKQILEHPQSKTQGFSNKEKLIRVVSRIQSSLYLSVAPMNYPEGETSFRYKPTAQNTFNMNSLTDQAENQMNYGMSMEYNLSNRLGIFVTDEKSLKHNKLNATSLGISYNIGLKSYGKKLLLSPKLAIGSTNYGVLLGEFNNPESFRVEGIKINSDKIKLYAGERAYCLQSGLTLKKDLSRSMKVYLGAEYNMKISSRELMYINESSGFFMFRRKTVIPLNSPEITYSTSQSRSWTDSFYLSSFNFKVGVIFGK